MSLKVKGIRDTKKRHYCYAEVPKEIPIPDGNNDVLCENNRGLLGQIIDTYYPLIPKDGGVVVSNFIIITPKNEPFYGFSYNEDLEGWKKQIVEGAEIVGVRLAKIIDEKYFVISDGTIYPLEDCEFERYNFYYIDEFGERKIHRERERIDKKELFPNNNENNYKKEDQSINTTQEE